MPLSGFIIDRAAFFIISMKYLLPAYAFALPLSLQWANILLVIILIYSLLAIGIKSSCLSTSHWKPALLFIAFFLIQAIALLYTDDTTTGSHELLQKSGLLIFPFAIFAFPPSRSLFRRTLFSFVIACLITALICFVCSLITYYRIGAVSWLSYTWLSKQMGFLPPYLAIYLGFSFFISLYYISRYWHTLATPIKISAIIILLFFFYMIIMLGARLVSVTFFTLLAATVLLWMRQKKQLLLGILVMSLIALTLWSLMSSFFVTRERMNRIIGKQRHNYEHNFLFNINDPRGQIWESSFQVLPQMPPWGYGIAHDVQNVLMPIYIAKNYEIPIKIKANAHNQYLQTLLATGYAGLLILLAALLIPLYLSWSRKMYLYTLFLLLLAIPMLTETILETPHGILFYAFFNSLFYAAILNDTLSQKRRV